MSHAEKLQSDPQEVLAKAVRNAGKELGLLNREIAQVLGMHTSGFSRMSKLDPTRKEGELALLLIRIARGLHALTGGDQQWIRHFMSTPNSVTGGIPKQQINSIAGLFSVLQFIDALRGKV